VLTSLDLEAGWQLLSSQINSPCWYERIIFISLSVWEACSALWGWTGAGVPGHPASPAQGRQRGVHEMAFEQRKRRCFLLSEVTSALENRGCLSLCFRFMLWWLLNHLRHIALC